MISPLPSSSTFLLPAILLLSATSQTASALPSFFPKHVSSSNTPHLAVVAKRATAYDGWTAKGCVSEGTGGRLLTGYRKQGVASLTVQGCLDICDSMAYAYAGLEFGNECFCSDTLENGGGAFASASQCSAPCTGDSTSICGGTGFITLYQSNDDSCPIPAPSSALPSSIKPSSSIAASSASIAVSSSVAPKPSSSSAAASIPTGSVGTWSNLGCVLDNSQRLLTGLQQNSGSQTIANCQALCKASGFAYAGVQYGKECYCGNALNNGAAGASMPSTDCNVACTGDKSTICGGFYRLNLYKFTPGSSPVTSSTLIASSTLVSSSAAAASKSATSSSLPPAFSSSVLASSSAAVPSPSSAKASAPSSSAIAPATTWTNLGCVTDNSKRLLTGSYTYSGLQTVETCQATCKSKGFIYAGLQYSRECYCGNTLDNGAGASAPTSDCNAVCGGDQSQTCGGFYRLNLYKLGSSTAASSVSPIVPVPLSSTQVSPSSSIVAVSSSSKAAASTAQPVPTSSVAPIVAASSATPLSSSAAASPSASSIAGAKWTDLGCVLDNSKRLLTGSFTSSSLMTREMCQDACRSKNFIYAGLQYSRECYCGNTLDNGAGASMPASDCNDQCLGNRTQTCGGFYRLTLLKYSA